MNSSPLRTHKVSALAIAIAAALLGAASPGISSVSSQRIQLANQPTPDAVLSATDGDLLVLNSGIFDPQTSRLAESSFRFAPVTDNHYFIVQFEAGKMLSTSQLEKLGFRVAGYVPNNAYLVDASGNDQKTLAELAGVRFVGAWQPAFKVSDIVRVHAQTKADLVVEILGFQGAPVGELETALIKAKLMQSSVKADMTANIAKVRVSVKGADLKDFVEQVAAIGEVSWIDLFELPHLHNVDAVGPIQSGLASGGNPPTAVAASIWARGLIGTGQIVAVVDSGMDRNQAFFNRYDRIGLNNEITDATTISPPTPGPVFPNRKVFGYFVMPGASAYDDNRTCPGGSSTSFHGTHTSGTTVGDSGTAATPTSANYNSGDGMAPQAQLLFMDIGNDSTGCLSGDAGPNMFLAARNAGAFIVSNSYGSGNSGAYNARDIEIDDTLWRTEDMLIAFSAGNDGAGANTIGHPAHAKHALTVGALGHGNSTTIAGFSSRGPTADGRRKPDIQAPGSATISARGNDDDTNPPANLDDAATQSLSGTSMSCPTVAGGAALMRQYFVDGYYPTGAVNAADVRKPLGAEMKAVLLNGTGMITTAPDNNYGWGRIFLDKNLYFPGDLRDLRTFARKNEAGVKTGQTHSYTVNVLGGLASQEFRATLVWYDPAGTAGAARALVNNLDLEVSDGTNTYKGNVISGSGAAANSTVGGVADITNPVEQVILTVPAAGSYTISVKGTAVPGNGVNGSDRQGYGLVISTATAPSAVVTSPAAPVVTNTAGIINASVTAVANATSYQLYRAPGTCASASAQDFQLIATSATTAIVDDSSQGGFSYAYKVRGADVNGEGPISACAQIVSSAPCTLTPSFDTSSITATKISPTDCATRISWTPGVSSCPLGTAVRYSVYRSTDPFFTPSAANRIATNISGPEFNDTTAASLTTYFYAVRAEDSTTGNPGPNGGNETTAISRLKYTPAGNVVSGTFADGADSPSFMELGTPWYLSNLQASAGTLSYRNALPGALTYLPDICAAITTPALAITAGASLSYKARYNIEQNWDGVVVEISTDNGATWVNLPPAAGYPATLSATQGNACNYPATQGAFTGSSGNAFVSASSSLAAFAGQNARIRWRFTADGGAEELGFFLDEVQVTNSSTPAACTTGDFTFRNGFE